MYNHLHSRYKINDKYDIYEDGYLMKNGACSEYLERVNFVKNTDESVIVFEINEIEKRSGIRFAIKDTKNALDIFLSNLLEFLCMPDNLLYKNNRVRTEYVSEVLDSEYLEIGNAIVDNNLLLLINKYFNSLKQLYFNNCIIESNCCFNQHNFQIISFNDCKFESIRSLNDLKSYSLGFKNCVFNSINCTTINVKRLDLQSDLDEYYENIFIHCYFPKLDCLYLRGFGNLDKSLMFLPYSCPNISSLNIFASNIKDKCYLYNLSNLSKIDIYLLEDVENDIDVRRKFLRYSMDDIEIYLKKKEQKIVYKSDESVDDDYYLMYDVINKEVTKERLSIGDRLYSWKNASWIEEEESRGGVRRKISPVICPKASIIHPSGKVLLLSSNPYNYSDICKKNR